MDNFTFPKKWAEILSTLDGFTKEDAECLIKAKFLYYINYKETVDLNDYLTLMVLVKAYPTDVTLQKILSESQHRFSNDIVNGNEDFRYCIGSNPNKDRVDYSYHYTEFDKCRFNYRDHLIEKFVDKADSILGWIFKY